MRLSLLEHEDQLRREADAPKDGTASVGPARPSSLVVPVPAGPSNSSTHGSISNDPTPCSSAPVSVTTSVSPSPSPGPSHEVLGRHEHDAEQSWQSSARPHPNPIATLQGMNDTSAVWRRRTSSPPPFTTLSAAMGAAATATAVLDSTDPAPAALPMGTHVGGEQSGDAEGLAPTITVSDMATAPDASRPSHIASTLTALHEPLINAASSMASAEPNV
jgi:hypothetical protein